MRHAPGVPLGEQRLEAVQHQQPAAQRLLVQRRSQPRAQPRTCGVQNFTLHDVCLTSKMMTAAAPSTAVRISSEVTRPTLSFMCAMARVMLRRA